MPEGDLVRKAPIALIIEDPPNECPQRPGILAIYQILGLRPSVARTVGRTQPLSGFDARAKPVGLTCDISTTWSLGDAGGMASGVARGGARARLDLAAQRVKRSRA